MLSLTCHLEIPPWIPVVEDSGRKWSDCSGRFSRWCIPKGSFAYFGTGIPL